MKKPDSFYLTTYQVYKTLPKISLIITAVVLFMVSVVLGQIIGDEAFVLFIVLSGLITGAVYIYSTILIAPIILQTDALIALQEELCKDDNENNISDFENKNNKQVKNKTSNHNNSTNTQHTIHSSTLFPNITQMLINSINPNKDIDADEEE